LAYKINSRPDRGLSQDSIQEELEDELLGFLLEISYVYVFGF